MLQLPSLRYSVKVDTDWIPSALSLTHIRSVPRSSLLQPARTILFQIDKDPAFGTGQYGPAINEADFTATYSPAIEAERQETERFYKGLGFTELEAQRVAARLLAWDYRAPTDANGVKIEQA